MHDVVPRNPCSLNTRSWLKALTIRRNDPVTGENSTINHDCSDRSKQLKVLSGLLGCRPFFGITLNYWLHFLDIVKVFQTSTLAGCQELAAVFEPSRNEEIFWKKNDNKRAYLRWMLFTSSSLNARILPDKNTNALSSSGIICFIELPSAYRSTPCFSSFSITPCLRWLGQQIRVKISGICGPK